MTIAAQMRDLDFAEIEAMLRSQHYGRLAFAFRDRVDIEPIHYVYDDGWIYGRTAPGTKLTVLTHHPWVAFEIDEVRDLFEWRSAVVKGTVYFVEPDGSPQQDEVYDRALAALRQLVPETLAEGDPAHARTVVFRIHIDEMHGRAATTAS